MITSDREGRDGIYLFVTLDLQPSFSIRHSPPIRQSSWIKEQQAFPDNSNLRQQILHSKTANMLLLKYYVFCN
jgi:hypothetical protein